MRVILTMRNEMRNETRNEKYEMRDFDEPAQSAQICYRPGPGDPYGILIPDASWTNYFDKPVKGFQMETCLPAVLPT